MKRSEFSFCVLTTLECRADAVEGQMTLTDTGMKRAILETRDSLPVVRSPDFDFTLEGELGASPAARRRKRLEEQVGIASEEDRPICTETGFTACRILGRESQWEASREPVRVAIGIPKLTLERVRLPLAVPGPHVELGLVWWMSWKPCFGRLYRA